MRSTKYIKHRSEKYIKEIKFYKTEQKKNLDELSKIKSEVAFTYFRLTS